MKNTLLVLIGLPGSGKSTKAKELAKTYNATIVSSDEFRKKEYGEESVQGNNSILFEKIHNEIINLLKEEKKVIFDACNLSHKHRKQLLDKISKLEVNKMCLLFGVPVERCLERNRNRERVVPEHVIVRMANNFNVPLWSEGWDNIEIIWDYNSDDYILEKYLEFADKYDQKNHNHSMTLGHHSRKVAEYIKEYKVDDFIYTSALLHDCAKPLTQVFHNMKGEKTEIAHYYDHHNRGAYEILFYGHNLLYSEDEILFMSALVNYHMRLYQIDSEKSRKKLLNTVGEDLMYFLEMLNECDKKSK